MQTLRPDGLFCLVIKVLPQSIKKKKTTRGSIWFGNQEAMFHRVKDTRTLQTCKTLHIHSVKKAIFFSYVQKAT